MKSIKHVWKCTFWYPWYGMNISNNIILTNYSLLLKFKEKYSVLAGKALFSDFIATLIDDQSIEKTDGSSSCLVELIYLSLWILIATIIWINIIRLSFLNKRNTLPNLKYHGIFLHCVHYIFRLLSMAVANFTLVL